MFQRPSLFPLTQEPSPCVPSVDTYVPKPDSHPLEKLPVNVAFSTPFVNHTRVPGPWAYPFVVPPDHENDSLGSTRWLKTTTPASFVTHCPDRQHDGRDTDATNTKNARFGFIILFVTNDQNDRTSTAACARLYWVRVNSLVGLCFSPNCVAESLRPQSSL